MSQFSFQTPKPLQENYVRKRPRLPSSCDVNRSHERGEGMQIKLLSKPTEINGVVLEVTLQLSKGNEDLSIFCHGLIASFNNSSGKINK